MNTVMVPSALSDVKFLSTEPWARFYERDTSFARLIPFDKRGTGFSTVMSASRSSKSEGTTPVLLRTRPDARAALYKGAPDEWWLYLVRDRS